MEEILNFRPLAEGLRNRNKCMISPHAIFRSGAIHHANKRDLQSLESRNIRTVYDLRSGVEMKNDVPVKEASFDIKHIEIMKDARQNDFRALLGRSESRNEEFMLDLYAVKFVRSKGFRRVIKEILSRADEPFLFHCTAGKDRTGIFGAILMMILEFDEESIRREYLRIDHKMIDAIARRITTTLGIEIEEIPQNLEPLFVVKGSYIDAFISSIHHEYGNLDDYIQIGLGVSDHERKVLNARYLSAAPQIR